MSVFLKEASTGSLTAWISLIASPENWPAPTWLPEKAEVTTARKSKIEENKPTIADVLDKCEILKEPYNPPVLWGRNGHIQTAIYGVLGHSSLKRTFDKRHVVRLNDGTSVTFDVFEPIKPHKSGKDYTLALTPGIANSSESNYIRTAVHYAQEAGYRCAVLNHLGVLANVTLTSARIFSYGGTEELEAMMDHLSFTYPETKFISVGFSMGANITTRYLYHMNKEQAQRVVVGIAIGLGYCALKSTPMYHDWENGRRAYNYIITENMKRLLRRNYETAVAPHVRSGLVDEQALWRATSIVTLDEAYNRRVNGYKSLEEFYRGCSSLHLLPTFSTTRMVFLNALDDPIVPLQLWQPVKELCSSRTDLGFILTKHGGHLGFLEGSSFAPHSVTWLDRIIVEYANAAVEVFE
ncbi:hypothetical protein L596_007299 [Steinernema carpocapsae]|uniref:Ig-like domain-containing protein n=1 Tax=Steinernema carpocapsae TaxID=34508 RepID=A0A4V6A5Y5_STECR|nr:hypothetical protein L596_007299 [Steinernema carpocapsae]